MTLIRKLCTAIVTTALPLSVAMADPAIVMAPGGAGGGYDAAARVPLQVMQETGIFTDGSQVTNKGGAGGTIGLAEFVRTAKGNDNGIMSLGSIIVGAIILNKSPITLDDVTPLVRLTNDAGAVAVPMDSPFKTIQDVTTALAADPGAVPIGGGSIGGVDHVAAALLAQTIPLDPKKINYVAYDGGAEMITALAGGQLKVAISGLSELGPYAEQGRLRLIGVTSAERLPNLDVPTLKEQGVDVVIGNWRGVVGAPGMSEKGRQMWLDRYAKMHATPEWKKTLTDHNWTDAYLAGDDFAAFLEEEKVRQGKVLESVGLIK